MIALARAKPGSLNYGSSGVGAPLHLQAEMFKHAAGLDIAHIPYRGDAPMLTALLVRRHPDRLHAQSTGVPQVQSRQIRGLAITGRNRSTALPDLPTLLEAGVKGLEDGSWYGLFAPAGTPPDIVARLQREMAEVLKSPDVDERLRSPPATSRSAARRKSSTRSSRPTSASLQKSSPTRKFRNWTEPPPTRIAAQHLLRAAVEWMADEICSLGRDHSWHVAELARLAQPSRALLE